MQRLKAIVLLTLLGVAVPPLLQAQLTESYTFTTNRVVPDGNAPGLSDVRTLNSAVGAIASIKVRLKITGDFNGDLYGYVRHSSGFTVLLNRPGKSSSNESGYSDDGLDVTFQTGATNGEIHVYQNVTTPADGSPLTGTWEPDGRAVDPTIVTDVSTRSTSLTNFNGLNAAGEWTLYLADIELGGTNMLTEWGLDITGATSPTLAWANPADITYGTALSGTQLNASATYNSTNVPGTFTYTPASGAVLNAGLDQILSLTFTPADTSSFLPITTNVTINVQPAPFGSNSPPVLSMISNATVRPGAQLRFTVWASGTNGGPLTFSLDPGAPVGASITSGCALGMNTNTNYPIDSTRAAFVWVPTRAQASTTNFITVRVTDNGTPPLSATQTFVVIVEDYLDIMIGSTNGFGGQIVGVPINLASSDGVTNLVFNMPWPAGQFTNPSLTVTAPGIASASTQDQITNLLIAIQMAQGQALQGTQQIAQLNFLALANQPSAFVSLPIGSVSAVKPGGSVYTDYITQAGVVAVVRTAPLLDAAYSTNLGRSLICFGNLGVNYQLQYSTNLAPPTSWGSLLNYTQTNAVMTMDMNSSNPVIFYRLFQP